MNEASTCIDDQPHEEQLEDFVADLLSQKKYQGVVERLFAHGKGAWAPLKALYTGYVDLDGAWEWVGRLGEEELVTTWLDYPGTHESEGLAVILFFYPRLYWSKTAFYNRNLLPKRADLQHEDAEKGRQT
jgi:hypothetical protein